MSENLRLTLQTTHSYEVATFSGGTETWTPNSSGGANVFNVAINGNTQANANGGYWYYPWYAATAGTGTQTARVESVVTRSICPKGWRLPSHDATYNYSYDNLILDTYAIPRNSTGVTMLKTVPFLFERNIGSWRDGKLTYPESVYYWTSEPHPNYDLPAYVAGTSNDYTITFGTNGKYYGFFVRCVAI